MEITKNFKSWLDDNNLNYQELGFARVVIADFGTLVEVQGDVVINSKNKTLELIIQENVVQYIFDDKITHVTFEFGGKFYYTAISHILNIKLNLLKNVGRYDDQSPEEGKVFLGVHGRYEMMNGTRDYSDWVNKAKFLNYKSLGICEKNTLAGTLPFQMACMKAGMKPIIGYTVEVQGLTTDHFDIGLYVVNNKGWINALRLNKLINIDQEGFVTEKQLLEHSEGLIAVIHPGKHVTLKRIESYKKSFEKAFFKITTNEYKADVKDVEVLSSMKNYIDNFRDVVDPILISDAYCIDFDDVHLKTTLNKQGKVKFNHSTTNHYFKSIDDQFHELEQLFNQDDDRLFELFIACLKSLEYVDVNCSFNINTNELFLPKYEMTKIEVEKYGDTTTMFDQLIREGMFRKYANDFDGIHGDQAQLEIEERIETERSVILKGGFVDYFLILWDIINWCNDQQIETGPGRGSAAGSVISYVLGIVKINPLEFGLIFERFLNEARIESELPDIDVDFASDRRDDVIQYMKDRYGGDYVCRVGTYGTLQMKGVLKELTRAYGFEGEKYNMNFVTSLIEKSNSSWEPMFNDAVNNKLLKGFIEDNPRIVNDARIALNSIKSSSMHACATIIVPKIKDIDGNEMTIFDQIPVRIDESGMLISEWEGDMMADAGFLKEDILSTKQMAKIGQIINLVEERTGKRLDMEYDVPLDDENVYNLFKQGSNQDVFHFGSSGLTTYLKGVQPENIDELIASIALYRPGAMASNAHNKFIKLKKGEERPHYDYMLEEVTKDTYGLYVYQEQIMKAVQVLGDFTLSEADGVRKAMGKKIQSKMDGYKIQFVENAVIKGCPIEEANEIWTKMEVFAGYGFNKSHAAAYSVIGYQCNWLKYHYPLEFWTVAFQLANNDKIPDFVAEIKRMGYIGIVAPDINKSLLKFHSDHDEKKIYWNLSQIKFVGPAAADAIISDRDKNGKFFSMEEFIERMPSQSVNKRTIEYLILAGCFDEMYDINRSSERLKVLQEFYSLRKQEVPKEFSDNEGIDHYYSIKQSEVSKLSNLDYDRLFEQTDFSEYKDEYISSDEFSVPLDEGEKKDVMIAGIVVEAVIRKTKKDKREYAVIKLMQDEYSLQVRVWPQQLNSYDQNFDQRFDGLKEFIVENKSKLCIFRGKMEYNDWVKGNELVLSDRIPGKLFEVF